MKKVFHILINGKPLHPSGGEPYKYSSYLDAAKTCYNLYGNWKHDKAVKIVEVSA